MAAALHTPTRLLHLLSLTCLSLLVVAEFTHDRKRVGPLDMVRAEHGCLEKFDVSESTIIRTEDSRMLGAQFLNESDVGNREDCLALCCATRFCNVAVFEEKHSGSCYLFDCGKHEDLKCQFTSHSYYTSAVLRVNRHQLELGLWSEQSQHEAELANLSKGLGDAGETLNGPRSRNLPPTTPPQQPPPTATPHALTSHQPHHHHCPPPPLHHHHHDHSQAHPASKEATCARSHGVMVTTLDFEFRDQSSSLGGARGSFAEGVARLWT
ncbi:hypothetical protein O3P69_000490 [Scylla paramamosain]|uniref:MANSC domain-containing protein n=1 Tax=Scylla paramamosain TaxID=85552 RepID=A0AAW0UW59_SCYPA